MDMEALRSVIMADSPLAYFRLYTTLSSNPVNEGSIPMTCTWQGGAPAVVSHPDLGDIIKLTNAEWVKLEGNYTLNMVNGLTIEALVQADTHQLWARFFELGTTSRTGNISLAQADLPGQLSSVLGSTFNARLASGFEYRKLIHLVVTHNPATNRVMYYMNGVLVADLANVGAAPSALNFQLGNLFYSLWAQTTSSGDQKFDGYAVYIAAYHEVLTPAKIKARSDLMPSLGSDLLVGITTQWGYQAIRSNPIAANQETLAQFQPQDVAWRGGEGRGFAGPVSQQPNTNCLLCQPGPDLFWTRAGVQAPGQGYIESTVTISGEGVRRRVLCYTQEGALVGETWSRASDGKYRFDLLWLNRRYMLVAQDDPTFGPADYNAVAADYQQPTPYAPGQGVGLV